MAQSFYTWVVDGGLEDGIIDTLSQGEISVDGIVDFNNETLDIAILSEQSEEANEAESTEPEEDSATGCPPALSAFINGKESPNRLYVHGSILVFGSEDEVCVTEASPQGINERILILDVSVVSTSSPMKGVCRHFSFEKEVTGRVYDQVTLRFPDKTEKTVDVAFQG